MQALLLFLLLGVTDFPGCPAEWRSGILVMDGADGTVIWEENANDLFRPASTVKLVTTLLALEILGPSYVYSTSILADSSNNTIYLSGSGAPLLSAEDVVRASMETAAQLGSESSWNLRFDVSCFIEESHLPGWDTDDWGRTYCPPIEALCIGDNVVEIIISSVDGVIRTWVYPPLADLTLHTSLLIAPVETVRTTVGGWETGLHEITLEGSMRPENRLIIYKPFPGAPFELISWLEMNLERSGLSILSIGEGEAGDDSQLIPAAVMYSDPLYQILTSMNKWSRNMVAEQVLRTVSLEVSGSPGSTGSGCDLAGQMLAELVPGSTGFQLADGSGLSRLNRLAPVHLAAVILTGISSLQYGPEFLASLPVNGVDGTLSGRMDNLPPGSFRGKTGTLNDTCSIAGILHSSGGKNLIVVIMLEIPEGHVFRARKWQDEVISFLYESF